MRTFGSSPLREGATLLRADDGRMAGSVSGGCVEGATAERLADARASGLQRVLRYGISDARAQGVGLACGGTIDVLVQPRIPAAVLAAARAAWLPTRRAQRRRAVVTTLAPGSPGSSLGASELGPTWDEAIPLVVSGDGRLDGVAGRRRLDAALVALAQAAIARGSRETTEVAGTSLLHRGLPTPASPRHRGRRSGGDASSYAWRGELGYETIVIDGRSVFATPERFPGVDRLIVGWPDEVADEIAPGSGRCRGGPQP